ncbi:MAG: sugar phosphate isomerase/epimerase [Oscillospiraceae bacterium]|nr:sugar phosphate isomerase/epimerase [Oscillospiraceae bacterium]
MQTPIAIQLYSLRSVIHDDFLGTLRKVKEAGYDAVEFAGEFGGRTAMQLKQELKDIGLTPLSTHFQIQRFDEELESFAAFCKELGMPFANCSGSTVESCERVEEAREKLIGATMHFAKLGIEFGYHNHWAEFEVRNDQYIQETLLRPSIRATMRAQFDTAWVRYYDIDPAAYMRQWGNRMTPPHFKDLNANYKEIDPAENCVEVGNGIIDFEAVVAAMRDMGVLHRGIIVERESFDKDIFESIAIDAANIRKFVGA